MSRSGVTIALVVLLGGGLSAAGGCLGAEYRKIDAVGGAGGVGGVDCSPLAVVPPGGCDPALESDSANCCVPGRDCLGAACVQGLCEERDIAESPGTGDALDVVLFDDLLLWSTGGDGTIMSVPQSGNGPRNLVAADPNQDGYCTALAADDTHVYWVQYGGTEIYRADPRQGSGSEQLVADTDPEQGGWGRITVDESHVFWATAAAAEGGGEPGNSVWMAAKDGTEWETPTLIHRGGAPHGVAVDDTHVYWTDLSGTVSAGVWRIARAEIGSGQPEQWAIADSSSEVTDIVIDDGTVYWLDGGTVKARSVTGGTIEELGDSSFGWSLAVDEQYVYWTAEYDNTVYRAFRESSGTVALEIGGGDTPTGLAVGCQAVYWSNDADIPDTPDWVTMVRK